MHWKPHMPSEQVACVAPVGTGQGAQLVAPHAFTSSVDGHDPLHACVPIGQLPLHASAASMQAPLQSFRPDAQAPPHIAPSHVAVPSTGAWHGVHDFPHVRGSVSLTHPPGQRCCPPGQVGLPVASGWAPVSWAASGALPSGAAEPSRRSASFRYEQPVATRSAATSAARVADCSEHKTAAHE
jgi:hypothetical protein